MLMVALLYEVVTVRAFFFFFFLEAKDFPVR